MKKFILAALLAAASTMVGAELLKISEQVQTDISGARIMTTYFDTISEQYCLLVIDGGKEINSLMHCKGVHELSEQAQRNILGDAYVPKSGAGACDASSDSCPKN
ncbi:hypothetical protein [Endozoicomonas sp. 8E]|uniref:hypothetical protein n=1 Tax=Endozoicomonas sp. 8E TaxID=3035692 RepID=UPI002938E04B|nr:hypothetical protein [Endozoicomonas sp. 8E]WOG29459.1 hypothetical protein P6910_07365 [Endozoicomonas sp. 8E]